MSVRWVLLVPALLLNIALWLQYALLSVRTSDFGSTPVSLRTYLLASAAVAYVCNLAYIGIFAGLGAASAQQQTAAVTAVIAYYTLQLAFLPLARAGIGGRISKIWTRALLCACVAPMVALAVVAIQLRHVALIATGLVTLVHVTLNDAVLYGALF